MKSIEFLGEGLNHPVICVDVQPEYANYGNNAKTCTKIIQFVCKQTGPVLFFVNAEDQGLSGDTVADIVNYWDETIGYAEDEYGDYESQIDWNRFTIVDKGYGYLRDWMDHDVSPKSIIKVIRLMYQFKVSDSRELFDGSDSDTYDKDMFNLIGHDYVIWMKDSGISVNWTSIAQLKRFSGAYIVGGGRNECLREVELLMNAFNIKYKRIDSLVY